jgi:hypothetical protein
MGHLGDSNDLTLLATLAGVEMGLLSGIRWPAAACRRHGLLRGPRRSRGAARRLNPSAARRKPLAEPEHMARP